VRKITATLAIFAISPSLQVGVMAGVGGVSDNVRSQANRILVSGYTEVLPPNPTGPSAVASAAVSGIHASTPLDAPAPLLAAIKAAKVKLKENPSQVTSYEIVSRNLDARATPTLIPFKVWPRARSPGIISAKATVNDIHPLAILLFPWYDSPSDRR
jgi:hypothetical protein